MFAGNVIFLSVQKKKKRSQNFMNKITNVRTKGNYIIRNSKGPSYLLGALCFIT